MHEVVKRLVQATEALIEDVGCPGDCHYGKECTHYLITREAIRSVQKVKRMLK